jgi:site-specific recombinase XerD
MREISQKVSPKVRAKATPEELAERLEQRRQRCLELKAIVAEEAARRGGRCEHPGCEVEWSPGTLGAPNPLVWRQRPRKRDDEHKRQRAISQLVNRAITTDRELKDELKRCTLLCRPHHKAIEQTAVKSRKRKLAKGIDPHDLEKLLAAPNIRTANGLRWRVMLELMAKCGMRVSEVCNLTIRDLHQDDEWKIEINDSKTGDRMIYLPAELEPLMNIWLGQRATNYPRSKWLFPTANGGRVTRGNIADMLDRMTYRAGIEDTHPHALRHTFATEFLRKPTHTVADLQGVLGHTTGTMSLRYAMANPDRIRKVMRGL